MVVGGVMGTASEKTAGGKNVWSGAVCEVPELADSFADIGVGALAEGLVVQSLVEGLSPSLAVSGGAGVADDIRRIKGLV